MWREIIIVALRSLRGNRLRSGLTVSIIAIGITCLVGIQTSIEVLTSIIAGFYENVGVQSFTVTGDSQGYSDADLSGRKNSPSLSYGQVKEFIGDYSLPAKKCIFSVAADGIAVKAGGISSDPDIRLYAVEGDFLDYQGMKISQGRYFSGRELTSAEKVCIVGSNLSERLFRNGSPTEQSLRTPFGTFRIIGVLESMGALFGGGGDSSVLIPVECARRGILPSSASFSAGIIPARMSIDEAVGYAESLMRKIRRLKADDSNDFTVETTDALDRQLSGIKESLSLAALAAGLLTILGAAVGLMNIMLVTIKERTREIGTRKTMGATSSDIKFQFLTESVVIGQIGGILGIVIGTAVGNLLSLILEVPAVLPWKWIALSVTICFAVSILSGYIPAKRAAALDPIEALRQE
ncbi:MAG: ABC transporter permease [Bacteroidales bacterium]|nr:ABC transporter permease [Bacteroidales bacterium]